MKIINQKVFGNGRVFALKTKTGKIVETTDTFLPYYTKNAIGRRKNALLSENFGSRKDRWMIGISTMSGCPIGCKFCASGGKFHGNLIAEEMLEQVEFVLKMNEKKFNPEKSKEFRILLTRMGEPALNYKEVCKFIKLLKNKYSFAEVVISTVGIRNPALDNFLELSKQYPEIHLQFSIHTTDESYRNWLIPFNEKLTFEEINQFAKKWMAVLNNKRKISLNFTIVERSEFNIEKIKKYFPKDNFFIKLSPINKNYYSVLNKVIGAIKQKNKA